MRFADYRENSIEWYENDKRATVSLTQGRYKTKVKKLAEKYPDECQIVAENPDGSIVAHIPTRWVRIQPTQKRNLTEEEKDILREKLKKSLGRE